MSYKNIFLAIFTIFTLFSFNTAQADEKKEKFNVTELLFGHIQDSHEWHITDIPSGDGHYTPIALHLPWIVYSSETGMKFFFLHGHSEEELAHSAAEHGFKYTHEHLTTMSGASVIDLSITKTVFQMMIVAFIMIVLFGRIAARYKKDPNGVPKGAQSFLEPIIIFIRDEVAKPNLGHRYAPFMPYLLSLFFFIWFSNIFGLTPLNSNIGGNISVTAALAFITLLITNLNGNANYWGHIFWYPGVPLPVKLLMMVVEVIGIFTKPFALMIRLFANISAGHFMILSLISLIFMFSKGGESLLGGFGVAPLSVAFTLFIMTLEVLVAIVQAYVFVLLTCVFIGAAMEEHHHEEAHH